MCAQGPRGCIGSIQSFARLTISDVADFDEYVYQHVEARQKRVGFKVKWYDLYGIHPKHKDPPEKRMKIDLSVQPAEWEAPSSDQRRPKIVFTQWFHNAGSKEMENKFSRQTTYKNVYKWSVTRGLTTKTLNSKLKVDLEAPKEVSDVCSNISEVLDLTKIDKKESKNTEFFLLESKIVVPPKRSVKVDVIMMEREVEVPWTCNVIISGRLHAQFSEKHNKIGYKDSHGKLLPKSKTWWYCPSHLEDNVHFFKDGEYNLRYEARGTFYSIRGSTPQIKIMEVDLQDEDASGLGVPVPPPRSSNLQTSFKR